jgi:hypothetical protein
MDKREFYGAVASKLGIEDPYVEMLPYRRRWGQRKPGNGRFPGFGLVRWFSESYILVTPEGGPCKVYDDPDSALSSINGPLD